MSVLAFAPSRNSGAMFHGTIAGGRANWQAGAFLTTDDQGAKAGDGGYSVAARLSGLAVGEERERLWAKWAEYGDDDIDAYAQRRPQETAVVVLEPVG